MTWISYGYFVRLPDGRIAPAGHDFAPTTDSYSVGDSLGVRGDSEGFVIGILKGQLFVGPDTSEIAGHVLIATAK